MTRSRSKYNSRFWDRAAGLYTLIQEGMNRKVYEQTYSILRPQLNCSDTVFEMAAGTGQFASVLSSRVRKWIATDFSAGMVEKSARRLRKCSNVEVRQEDATAVVMGSGSADVVLVANALHVMPNPHLALREAHRLLKDDGRLLAPTFLRKEKDPWLMKLYKRVGFKTFETFSKEELTQLLEDNGFRVELVRIVESNFLPECVIVARRIKQILI